MIKRYYVESECCQEPILWNLETRDGQGICTKCSKWSKVVNCKPVDY